MTDAELFELGLLNSEQATSMLNAYLTLTFAFVVVSYFAGARLNKVQVRVLSGLYFIGIVPMILGNHYFTIRAAEFEMMVASSYPITGGSVWGSGSIWAGLITFELIAGVIGSYYFLYSTRRGSRAA